ncbi:MAG: acetylxylan esterase [Planctomycetia bacterium]|nr:acetylxylan esterase [Planctomycetia bacterium]
MKKIRFSSVSVLFFSAVVLFCASISALAEEGDHGLDQRKIWYPRMWKKDKPEEEKILREQRQKTLLSQCGLLKEPDRMMYHWFHKIIDAKKEIWREKYESLLTEEDVLKYQKEKRSFFFDQLGPLWKKTPLNAKITGRIERSDCVIEKILFESLPQFYITGTMFLPVQAKDKPPYPVLLVVCGHSNEGKAYESYQKIGYLGAMNGLAVFIMDPIDQGERHQHLDEKGKPYAQTVVAHNLAGYCAGLVGRTTGTYQVWDMIRALDYLQSRPDILPDKIGVAGNSGGGTQSAFIMALDDRIKAAFPSCYLSGLYGNLLYTLGPADSEQMVYAQLEFGMDHADYCIMMAPRPLLIGSATKDYFDIEDTWKTFRYAKRAYARFSLSSQVNLAETDEKHGWSLQLREESVRWMLRWLAGKEIVVREPADLAVLSEDEIRSLPKPGVLGIPNAKTTYDFDRDLARQYQSERKKIWKKINSSQAADLVRKGAGIRADADIPIAKIRAKGKNKDEFVLETDPGIFLPVRFRMEKPGDPIRLFISDQGRFSEKSRQLFEDPTIPNLAIVELRGWGETHGFGGRHYIAGYGDDRNDYYLAFLLGKSYIGMRTEDLLSAARFFQKEYSGTIQLQAQGSASLIAIHAGIAAPDLFTSLQYDKDAIPRWTDLVEKAPTPFLLTDSIYGVLKYYDTDNLIDFLNR